MPAEWESHGATWIAWPHHEPDWPGKLDAVRWAYAEIVRALHAAERVEILCHDDGVREDCLGRLDAHAVDLERVRMHLANTDRVWLRDSAPTVVAGPMGLELINWRFNGWAKYDNFEHDARVGAVVARVTGLPRVAAARPDGAGPLVLEGGAIDTDGAGTLLVNEECLLSPVQQRNPGLDREGYERAFGDYLGVEQTIWLAAGCAGDDTHGHVDDVARFVAPGIVALAYEPDASDANHASSVENARRLAAATVGGLPLTIVKLPYPRAVTMRGERLPASYANFYVANELVLVPTFNDRRDRDALAILADVFPDRTVVGIHAVDLVWGFGTLHCLTQQQPAP
jgi:agmatine deiminase